MTAKPVHCPDCGSEPIVTNHPNDEWSVERPKCPLQFLWQSESTREIIVTTWNKMIDEEKGE